MNDKFINTVCACKGSLIHTNTLKVMCEPCEHIVHAGCLSGNKCPICHEEVKRKYTMKGLFNKLLTGKVLGGRLEQKAIDLLAVSHIMVDAGTVLKRVLTRLPINLAENLAEMIRLFSLLMDLNGFDKAQLACQALLNIIGCKVVVKGLETVDLNRPRIYIANHQSDLDNIVMLSILKSGFVASTTIMDRFPLSCIKVPIPLLMVERGKAGNTTTKMKQYVREHGSVVIYPEGRRTHYKTLARFRTGAFHCNYPIYPVVMVYDPNTWTVTVSFLRPEVPPFSNKRIEKIREKMAKEGNFYLSRVSNHDIKDG